MCRSSASWILVSKKSANLVVLFFIIILLNMNRTKRKQILLLTKKKLLLKKKQAILRHREYWVHPINQLRDEKGVFSNLVQKLRLGNAVERHKAYLRIDAFPYSIL